MSDLIDRQAAIDELKTRRDAAKKWYDEVSVTDDILTARADSAMASFIEAILMIKKLPSAQPEKRTEERTETHECDLISRQAAIEIIEYECGEWTGLAKTITNEISALPSAQPERKIHFADADHVWIDGKQYISLGRFQEAVVEAQPERKTGRWIETEGLDEEIRCLMCTNHMRSDRGCDGLCQYNEHVYKEIMSALERRMMEVEHD